MNLFKHLLLPALLVGSILFSKAQSIKNITVNIAGPTVDIKPVMWGIFFEDINLAADGGLYAELVKNRSFEFTLPLMGWREQKKGSVGGSILVLNRGAKNENNPRYIRIKNAVTGKYGMSNDGFRGMGIQKNKRYDFSVWAKPVNNARLQIHVELVNAKGEILGGTILYPGNTQWKKYSGSFITTDTAQKAQLNIWFEGKGSIDLDMISLFPQDTWKNRPGGLRTDLVQLLADMKPGFIRFPGGCIVEGRDLANRYQWKKTVGNVEDRQLIINRWNTEFANRSTPDYFQSFGLGFYEYFLLAEDIGAAPLPILNCGMACQFNTSEVVPTDQLDPYIQDALDLIEFANGSLKTKWGQLRAGMGTLHHLI
jgi:alpha-N-arabinofuranosidase